MSTLLFILLDAQRSLLCSELSASHDVTYLYVTLSSKSSRHTAAVHAAQRHFVQCMTSCPPFTSRISRTNIQLPLSQPCPDISDCQLRWVQHAKRVCVEVVQAGGALHCEDEREIE